MRCVALPPTRLVGFLCENSYSGSYWWLQITFSLIEQHLHLLISFLQLLGTAFALNMLFQIGLAFFLQGFIRVCTIEKRMSAGFSQPACVSVYLVIIKMMVSPWGKKVLWLLLQILKELLISLARSKPLNRQATCSNESQNKKSGRSKRFLMLRSTQTKRQLSLKSLQMII